MATEGYKSTADLQTKKRAIGGGLRSSSQRHAEWFRAAWFDFFNVTSKSPVGDISVVTLIRTDSALDHS